MQYRIYYNETEITHVTREEFDGDFIVVDKDTYVKVMNKPSGYNVIDEQVVDIKKAKSNNKIKKFTVQEESTFPAWVVDKDNVFVSISYEEEKPDWYNEERHSVAIYD